MVEIDSVEEIKRRLNLIEVVGSYLPLKKAGRNFVGLCPFHPEKKPSFTVSSDKQVWHCFGCNAGGDLFSFVMKKEGMDFAEALELLAERAGVRLERRPAAVSVRKRILEANEKALEFFERELGKERGLAAREYLARRRVNQAAVGTFHLGYAPSQGLIEYLGPLGLTQEQLVDFGLAVRRDDEVLDKFRRRIIFPIFDHLGRIVAFTGRALGDDEPKYLNSPETPLFSKSRLLYNLNLAKEEILKRGFAVVVEGQTDVISSFMAGLPNVVGLSGTALTEDQLELLRRYGEKLILAFDNDGAGLEALKRSLPLAGRLGFKVKIAQLEEKDPDATIQKNPAGWLEALRTAQPAVEFFYRKAFLEFGLDDPAQKLKVSEQVIEALSLLGDSLERELYLQEMSKRLGVSEMSLREGMARLSERSPAISESVPLSQPKEAKRSDLEERLLFLLLLFPDNLPLFLPEIGSLELVSLLARKIYTRLFSYYTEGGESRLSTPLLLELFPPEERVEVGEGALVVEEEYKALSLDEIRREIVFYIRLLKERDLRERREELMTSIAQAEQKGDLESLEQLLKEFHKG